MHPFTLTLLDWFRENGRSLPWRETRDPYAIWLSEVILQQTRIEQGRPYWERFMRRWPTVRDLAAASEDEVLREWQGLGYYSRARNLHEAARQIVLRGGFPTTFDGLRTLKGVGDYTAAAIGSFAFNLPVAVVDGNVYRVLARHFGIDTPINTTEGKHVFSALAQSLLPSLPSGGPGWASLYNQAIMDFGATQCTPASPKCSLCPLQETCCAFRENSVAELPVKLKTLKVKERHFTYIYIRHNGQTALHRRPAGDIWQGLYEPLLVEGGEFATAHEQGQTSANSTAVANSTLYTLNSKLIRHNVRHVLTHRIIYADFYMWEPEECPTLPDGYFWIDEADIDRYALPRLVELLLEEVRRQQQERKL